MESEPASAKNMTGKVWFIDVVTDYGPGHHVPMHITLEHCAEILNANYLAIVDRDCPPSIGTEKWRRVLCDFKNPHLRYFSQLAHQRRFYRAIFEIKNQMLSFLRMSLLIRSIIKNIDKNANSIVIYLDFANPLQMIAVWFSVALLADLRSRTIVWSQFHGSIPFAETKVGRIARCLSKILPINIWNTTSTSEIATQITKYGWNVDVLPLPVNPFLDSSSLNSNQSDKFW